jgi:hypothetical protein
LIRRAVWSFWSAPFDAYQHAVWISRRHHLLSWVLSFERARRHFPETVLITDDRGKALLGDALRLPFSIVDTSLNALAGCDPCWWALGKLYAYAAQSQPFIHIDSDVYLWRALPSEFIAAPLFAQNPERFQFGQGWYRPDRWEAALKAVRGWVPAEWTWYVRRRGSEAASCGVLGGNDTAFISYYARNAIRIVEHPRNQLAWKLLRSAAEDNVLVEQYFLSACLYYHAENAGSEFKGIEMRYLFESMDAAFCPVEAERVGFTHLIAGSKRDRRLAQRLENRVRRDHPESYERVLRHCADRGLDQRTSSVQRGKYS